MILSIPTVDCGVARAVRSNVEFATDLKYSSLPERVCTMPTGKTACEFGDYDYGRRYERRSKTAKVCERSLVA